MWWEEVILQVVCYRIDSKSGDSVTENGQNSENFLPESQPSVGLGFSESVSANQWLAERNEDSQKASKKELM